VKKKALQNSHSTQFGLQECCCLEIDDRFRRSDSESSESGCLMNETLGDSHIHIRYPYGSYVPVAHIAKTASPPALLGFAPPCVTAFSGQSFGLLVHINLACMCWS
jgi:hypothetical protein